MNLKELQAWLNSEEGQSEEIKTYLQGLNPYSVEGMKKYIYENKDAKSWLDSEKDVHTSKSLESWKKNNLQKLIDEAVTKANPQETQEQKKIRELEERLNQKEKAETRQALLNKSLVIADEKKLPKDLLEYFLGENEETTTKNIEKLETVFNKHVETVVNERLKGDYKPPKSGNEHNKNVVDMNMDEYAKYWQEKNKK